MKVFQIRVSAESGIGRGIPVGTVFEEGTLGGIPLDEVIPCDGRKVRGEDFPDLLAAMSIAARSDGAFVYGGNADEFNLPDLRGRIGVEA